MTVTPSQRPDSDPDHINHSSGNGRPCTAGIAQWKLGPELRWFMATVREDFGVNRRQLAAPGFQAVVVYRFGVWIRAMPRVLRYPLTVVYRLAYLVMRNIYGIELPRSAQIGRRLKIPHQGAIVVSPESRLGDDCLIRQSVTVGRFNRGRKRKPPYAPTIGNGVELGAGAVVVGGITIGDRARIGPNAVVMMDVPAGGSAFAAPAKIMGPLGGGPARSAGEGT